jgi:hypothetical protein
VNDETSIAGTYRWFGCPFYGPASCRTEPAGTGCAEGCVGWSVNG